MISNCNPLHSWPDTDFQTQENPHISLFFAGTTSRISVKVQSHAGAEKRFRRGSVQTNRPFTGRLAAQGDVRRGRGRGDFSTSVLVFLNAWNVCLCVSVCVKYIQKIQYIHPPPAWGEEGYNWAERLAAWKMIEGKERSDANLTSFKIN